MNNKASAGNNSEKDRSDCFITIELTSSGGIQVELKSKVAALYGDSIVLLCKEIVQFFSIPHAIVYIEDKGALEWVIAARMEAAIRQCIKTDKQYLPALLDENKVVSLRDQHRISRLYLPGNTPALMINAGIHQPDAIILDLEDAVAVNKKTEAQLLVRNALRALQFMGCERMVRINQLPVGLKDLEFVIPHHANLIVVPKCESAEQLQKINARIAELLAQQELRHTVWLMPIIESALGVIRSFEIASAAENVVALAIGLEDYTADLGVSRTAEGTESLFARSQIVNACKAAGIQAIDSVFSDVGDLEGLIENVKRSKALGFEGMGCIHPRQIKMIHDHFAPTPEQITAAQKMVEAYTRAEKEGLGVVSLGTKMIDAPVVKRAKQTIDLAIRMNRLDPQWNTPAHIKENMDQPIL